MPTRHRQLLFLSILAVLALCAVLARPAMLRAAEAEPLTILEKEDRAPYKVRLTGAPDSDMQDLLESISATFGGLDRPPASDSLLKRRAESDVTPMLEALRSFGYFKATVRPDFTKTDKGKPEVTFVVDAGPRFSFGDIVMSLTPGSTEPKLPAPSTFDLVSGQPYAAAQVVKARDDLLRYLADRAHPFATVAKMRVVANHATNTVAVTMNVDSGPKTFFGPTTLEGLSSVDPDYVRLLLPWHEGEPYDASVVEKGRLDLFHSGLYSLVEVVPAKEPAPNAERALTITFKERAPRSVRVGIGYTTDFGPGLTLGWEHRNLFGRAEKLNLSLSVDQKRKIFSGTFRKPYLDDEDQSLVIKSDLADEQTDAYTGKSWDTSAVIERSLGRYLTVAGGLGYRYSDVRQADESARTFNLVYIPVTAALDTRDDVLNPTHGFLLSGVVSPYQDVVDRDIRFLKYRTTGNIYLPLMQEDRLVLACRASFGQILGQDLDDVPADLRFYSGGGGSVRGFGYQMAGSLHKHDPVGGLSVLEFSTEFRIKVTETIGLVPFLDAGRSYADDMPDLDQELFYGAGLGLRYYTGFGPLRLDVATPLNPREGVDSRYQVYVSIGQAF